MKKVKLNNLEYEIVENVNNCFNHDEVQERLVDVDYFNDFDYIFGDFSYDKVRLKGFNDSNSKKVNKINDIKMLDDYKKNYCSYGASTFLLKKIK
ncbi:MAG: DUF1027 domain-containing protein [Firmicutes bacterium]|nr:DUF1027 domain-containing protein [Bacillota bacterium]